MGKGKKAYMDGMGLELVWRLRYGHNDVVDAKLQRPMLTLKLVAQLLRLSQNQVLLRL